MSSPTVSTFQPGDGRLRAWRGWSCRRRAGRRRRCSCASPLGRGQLEDQHVLGEPALVARHDRGDAQRVALLAEQRVAAVARAVGPDLAGLGEVDDVLRVVARPRHVGLAGARAARRPSGRPGRRSRPRRAASRAGWPMRVMMRIETATYGESVISTPSAEIGEPSGPMQNGTTYIVRPRIAAGEQAVERARASRPGRSSCWSGRRPPRSREQMKVRPSTRATSLRVGRGVEASSGASPAFSRTNVPASTSRLVSRSHSSSEPSHHSTASGWVSSATSFTHAMSFACLVGGLGGRADGSVMVSSSRHPVV